RETRRIECQAPPDGKIHRTGENQRVVTAESQRIEPGGKIVLEVRTVESVGIQGVQTCDRQCAALQTREVGLPFECSIQGWCDRGNSYAAGVARHRLRYRDSAAVEEPACDRRGP